MSEHLHLKINHDEASLILNALSNLPYIQVHQLIHNIQAQLGPQLASQTVKPEMQQNGNHTKSMVS
ncbi:hypothetical protein DVR12_24180 [Chitinophaga silvatica]|uniref:Uncharacterized protein n=1 Tax=Chitinophaga silvatica TaxID=2282649 RepID=A0A3E1Y3X6_9BACT|nr:hypothetical protein [Chitinophaga silvatica]RFS19332.1 hypothetical protein DVR12_24180 [Chitinophaga silvatica]